MADTLPNVFLKAGVPVDLYNATGIVAGTQISVMNTGEVLENTAPELVVRLQTKATVPVKGDGLWPMYLGQVFTNETGDSGAWATAITDCSVNVKEVV